MEAHTHTILSFTRPVLLRDREHKPGKYLLIDLEEGAAYALNETARQLAGLVIERATLVQLRDKLLSLYEVTAEEAEKAVKDFITYFEERGLIRPLGA